MITGAAAAGQWTVLFTRADLDVPADWDPVVDACGDVLERQRALHIPNRLPILLSAHGEVDPILTLYFSSALWRSFKPATWETYAYEYATWMGFLGRGGLTWLDAYQHNFVAYKSWRTDRAANPDTAVGGATWDKAVFALRHLYDWALQEHLVEQHPVPAGRAASRVPGVIAESTNARWQRDRWVAPATYRLYREVGLRGSGILTRGEERAGWAGVWWEPDGTDRTSFRGRTSQRNAVFADLVYGSGLRLQEAGTLLIPEIPAGGQVESDLAASTAKFGKRRRWYCAPTLDRRLQSYIAVTRAQAVRRARREERYDRIKNIIWVERVERPKQGGLLHAILEREDARGEPVRRPLNELTPAERRRLFIRTASGPEPLALWLNEDGTPLHHTSWSRVLSEGSARLHAMVMARGGSMDDRLTVTPQSLRFSFALALLVGLHQQMDRIFGWDGRDGYDEGRYEQAYVRVRDVLGHKDVATTKQYYVPYVSSLRFEQLFAELGTATSTSEMISRLAEDVLEIRNLAGPGGR